MSFWDFLASSDGVALTHALILLITAVAAYVSFLARQQAKDNAHLLNHHLAEHIARSQSPAPPPSSDLPPEA